MSAAKPRVAVIGGGVAGLTAAHELSERGCAVCVFERREMVGGKSRSYRTELDDPAEEAGLSPLEELDPPGAEEPELTDAEEPELTDAAELGLRGLEQSELPELTDRLAKRKSPYPGLGPPGLEDRKLPVEHGFRFFPGFYTHVIETMKRIPAADGKVCTACHLAESECARFADGKARVACHLVESECALLTDCKGRRMYTPFPTPERHVTWRERWRGMKGFRGAFPGWWEMACFFSVLARLATSCERRWKEQLERESWLDYVEGPARTVSRSPEYNRLFAKGLTRTFVATRAEEMSAATGGKILLQLLYDTFAGPGKRRAADRVLDGPTSDVWIDPWREQLEACGVTFKYCCQVDRLHVDSGRVRGFRYFEGRKIKADDLYDQFDHYVLAVPCEVLKQLLVNTPELAKDKQMSRVYHLETRWMNGIVYGVKEQLPSLPKGHVLCLDSPWALTLVDQTQYWQQEHLERFKELGYETLLSVDISDWKTPGTEGVPAEWYPAGGRDEIAEEVWRQLRQHLRTPPPECPHFHLDVDIKHSGSERLLMYNERCDPLKRPIAEMRTNDEPLLVNTADSWRNRPEVTTCLENLFVAGDYVQTFTDFASMEAANEAARRAVNALLELRREDPGWCRVTDLEHPRGWFGVPRWLARHADRVLFRIGLRAPFRIPILAWIVLFTLSRPLAAVARRRPARSGA